MNRTIAILLAATACAAAAPAQASLLGVQVNGSLTFGSGSTNFFLASNGFVPGGYGNSASLPVTIASPITEFGFADGANLDTANFTATQLIVRDLVSSTGSNAKWTMTFTSLTPGAFTGLSLVSSNFAGLTYGLSANTITINWAGGAVTAGQDFSATFDVASPSGAVPEPATWALMIGGFGLIGTAMRRRSVKLSYAA